MGRRTAGVLLPIEISVLAAAVESRRAGHDEFHGFAIASAIQERDAARRLTAHGTLYRALARLEAGGLLESHWEDAEVAEAAGRPRRRLYQITGAGEVALSKARATAAGTDVRTSRLAPS